MKGKLLAATLIVLLGCDPLGRLTGTSTKHEDAPSQFEHPSISSYDGDLRGANFVTIDADGAKEVLVYLKRNGKWSLLEGFDSTQKSKDPYYILDKNTVIFMNTTVDDGYNIRVTK